MCLSYNVFNLFYKLLIYPIASIIQIYIYITNNKVIHINFFNLYDIYSSALSEKA